MHTRTGRLRFPSPCAVTVFVLESMARPVIDCGSLRSVDTCGHHGLYTAWTSEAHRQMSDRSKQLTGQRRPAVPRLHRVAAVRHWTPYRAGRVTATFAAKVSYLTGCRRNATTCPGIST